MFTGQSITLHVHNQLSNESLTVHMHGLHYRDNPYMDGVSMVSQCPILPGKNFTYTFLVSGHQTQLTSRPPLTGTLA